MISKLLKNSTGRTRRESRHLCSGKTALEDSTVAGLAAEFAKINKAVELVLSPTEQKNIMGVFPPRQTKLLASNRHLPWEVTRMIFVHGRFSRVMKT